MQKKTSTEQVVDDNNSKAALIMRLICIFWVMAKFISWKVWIKDRQYPLAPVFDWLNWPSLFHYILFVCSIALIVFLVLKPFNKIILIALLITELLSCVADQNRWQPWEYQYLFSIVICIINFNHPKKILACIAFVMAATYLYSGIGKFNEGYLTLVWDNIFLKRIFKLSDASIQQSSIHYSGYITSAMETIFAAGLLFSKTKKAAAWGMIFMHLFILYAIGPFGTNYNTVVWPWNILMMLLLYFIFIKNQSLQINMAILWQGWNKIVLIAWGILPALNYVGLWDSYLSSRLYSGGLPLMAICLKDAADIEELQPYLNKTDIYNLCNGQKMVNLQNWAMKEMNVPPYPEVRVYKKIEAEWPTTHPGSSAGFVYYFFVKQKQIQRIENK
ncbi:MAG: hypothetical protein V4685_19395 [Bacteroidota bacterium]